jgi:hypothetical protein
MVIFLLEIIERIEIKETRENLTPSRKARQEEPIKILPLRLSVFA